MPIAHRLAVTALAAFLILAGLTLGQYADQALPLHYLGRPIVSAGIMALGIGVVSIALPGPTLLVGAALTLGVALRDLAPFALLVASASVAVSHGLRLKGPRGLADRSSAAVDRLVLIGAVAFAVAGLLRAAPVTQGGDATDSLARDSRLPSIHLLLMDGYARSDSLAQLGIDNTPFLEELSERGFDLYLDATSAHTQTELTLLSLLNGSAEETPLSGAGVDFQRDIRQRLTQASLLPLIDAAGYELVVVDPPIGHVTFDAGHHIRATAINNFEETLLAPSALAPALTAIASTWPMDSLRRQVESSLHHMQAVAAAGGGYVSLTHLMAPHLPFLWNAEGATGLPSYWPDVQLFESVSEIIGLPVDEYVDGYRHNLEAVNSRVLQAIDSVIAANPSAPIVLFSDHGARYSLESPEEWKLTFLAARTPGHTRLYGEAPLVSSVLCGALRAYGGVSCDG